MLFAIGFVIVLTIALDPHRNYLNDPLASAEVVARQAAILGIFALGAGIVIIAGGIDLSSGSVIALSGAICASIIYALVPVNDAGNPITKDIPLWITGTAILGTIVVALMVGSLHAWLITVIRLPPFVATLASLVGLRSLARVIVQDATATFDQNSNTQIYIRDETFRNLAQVWWVPVLIFFVITFILWMIMTKTVTGRHLYAIGGNEEAARLSGIRTEKLKWLAYCIGAVTASIAGMLYSAYTGASAPAQDGVGYELNAIASSVVGGCALTGGLGSIPGIMLGALFLRIVIDSVSKTVPNNPDDFEGLVVGILVVLAVAFNELRGGSKRDGKQLLPGALGTVNLVVLPVLIGSISGLMREENKLVTALIVAAVTFAVLFVRRTFDNRRLRKR
ncbi:MAG: ABC transporter permease [Planctomycetota bacterium]